MKTFTQILTAAILAMFVATSCIDEDPAYKKEGTGTTPDSGVGVLVLNTMTMKVIYDTQTDIRPDDTEDETQKPSALAAPETKASAADSFLVELYNAANELVLRKSYGELMAEMTEPLPLPVGTYRLLISSEDPATAPAVAWEHPIYGTTRTITILKNEVTTISEVVCTLQNIKVSLICSADLASQLDNSSVSTVSLGATKATFAKGETRAAYFMPSAETSTMVFRLSGSFIEGGNASFTKNIPDVKAGQWRKITLVIVHGELGDVKFDIKTDSFILDEEVTVNGTAGLWEPILDEWEKLTPEIVWPGHDLDKPFQLLESMFILNGGMYTCTEPMRFHLTSVNGIGSFKVTISSTNADFMTSLGQYGIPVSFDLCSITPAHPAYALLQSFGFPLGDQVAQAESIDIAGAMPLLYKYPGFDGTHTFAFSITDTKDTEAKAPAAAALSILVNRGHENTAPTIVWRGYDIDQQYVVTAGMLIDIDIEASAGIRSLEVTIDSETLSPELPSMGIPVNFDLANITDPELVKTLGKDGLGFPTNGEVKDKTVIPFSITQFAGLLLGIPGEHNFVLKVTDNTNQSTTKTIKLKVNE